MNAKQAQTPQSAEILWTPERQTRLLQGTIATGTGLALLAALMDQVRSERRKTRASAGGRVLEEGGGTLTISPPPPKPPRYKAATFTEWVGGGAAGLGAYWLIQQAYQEMRRKQLQAEIAEEEEAYTKSLQDSVAPAKVAHAHAKVATSLMEILTSALQDTMILPGLLSAAGTYGLLEHTWPKVKEKAEAGKPKKIVVKGHGTVIADGPGDGPLAQLDKEKGKQMVEGLKPDTAPLPGESPRPKATEVMTKAAALEAPITNFDYKCAAEMLTFVLCEYPELRKAASALPTLIGACADNQGQLETLVKEAGVLEAVELSKGVAESYYALPHFEKRAAIHRAFSSPLLAPALTTLALAELNEVDSDLAKRAKVLHEDPEMSLVSVKAAALLWQGEIIAANPDNLKSAAAQEMQQDMRRQMGTLGLSETRDEDGTEDSSDKAYQDKKDPIDAFLAGKS